MKLILSTARSKHSPTEFRRFGYTDPSKVKLFEIFARIFAAIIIVIGILNIVGWYFDIPRLTSFVLSYPEMRASTAVAFIAAGIYVLFTVSPAKRGWLQKVCIVTRTFTSLIVLTIGFVRLWGFVTGNVVDLDLYMGLPAQLSPPASGHTDRLIPNTPFFFSILGLAMLFYDLKIRKIYYSQLLILVAGLVTMPMVLSYIYQIGLINGSTLNAALPTLVSYTFLILALLCARPTRQIMDIFTKDSSGGFLVRRLIIFAIILPLLVGWIILLGYRLGLYSGDFRYLLAVNSLIVLFIVLIWENAQSLHSSDVERRETELELLESQKKFSALAESNIIGVVLADLEGTIYEANDAFLRIVGYGRSDLTSGALNWRELTAPEFTKLAMVKNRELIKKGKVEQYEKEFIKKDKTRAAVIVGKTLLNKDKGIFIAFVLDIGERKRLEERKDEFISIASHELKTPLTSIKGYTQILERLVSGIGNKQAGSLLSKTNTYIDRLSGLIADLLDVSKIQSGKILFNIEKFDVYDVVKEAVEGIQGTLPRHTIQLKSSVHQQVTGDKYRLEQVLHNLLTNAIKYSPRADKVIVRMTKNREYVTISVQDFGIGIPAKSKSMLFHRFYRVESSSKEFAGLGIGLYISSEIVKRHNGKIRIESKEGEGSTFFVDLPIKNSPPRER